MATFYDKAKKRFAEGSVNTIGNGFYSILVSGSPHYVPDYSNHETTSDVTGIIATGPSLTTLSVAAGGIVTADNSTYTAPVGSPPESVGYVILVEGTTNKLVALYDGFSPLTTDALNNVIIQWNAGVVFRIQ